MKLPDFPPYLPNFSTKFESMIFAICLVDENSNKASARKFIEEIERTGIRDVVDVAAKMTEMYLAPCP